MSTEQDKQVLSPPTRKYPPDKLLPGEVYWKEQYDWLLSAGYRLRSRYSPDWRPSWVGTNHGPDFCEDAEVNYTKSVNHATSLKDEVFVVLKMINVSKYPDEVNITTYLSAEPLKSDPDNHSIPLVEVLHAPDDENVRILVLPLLRDFDDPPFETQGEAVHFLDQFFKAVEFLHKNRLVHGDISINNVMMDAQNMYPHGFHPVAPSMKADFSGEVTNKYSRTERAPKYYILDFGLSRQFELEETPTALDNPGTDTSVPEYRNDFPIDPFFVDVYCVGNMIRQEFLDGDPDRISRRGYYGFEFLRPLISDMVQDDPSKRPPMTDVVARFQALVKDRSSSELRSPCRRVPSFKGEEGSIPVVIGKAVHHWCKRITYILRRLPPVPQS